MPLTVSAPLAGEGTEVTVATGKNRLKHLKILPHLPWSQTGDYNNHVTEVRWLAPLRSRHSLEV
jgi:hypothetical protein